MKKILIDVELHKPSLEKLKGMPGMEVEVIDFSEEERSLPPELIRDINYLFCSFPCVNFEDHKSLEFIQIASAGYSQLFGKGLCERGIRASNARGVFDVPIAEWSAAMLVSLVRDMRGMIRNQEHGVWDRDARFQREIRGMVVGIWGYGSIGRETARILSAMGVTIHVLDRMIYTSADQPDIYRVENTGDPDGLIPARIFTPGREIEFLQGLDGLIMAMPLTNSTKGIVGDRELRALPGGAYLLNPARGGLIQEQALLSALRDGHLAGAALDTHYYYPMPADHPLWRFPNVIMTPHISGSSLSPRFTERVWDIFARNVERLQAGSPLLNELTISQLKGE